MRTVYLTPGFQIWCTAPVAKGEGIALPRGPCIEWSGSFCFCQLELILAKAFSCLFV